MTDKPQNLLPKHVRGLMEPAEGSAMCALTLIYHEEFEPAVLGVIQRCMTVARYTKIHDVIGARTDMMQEADYQPHGQNHMLMMFAERQVIHQIADEIRKLRRNKRHGVRGYVTPVEEVI